MISGKPTAPIRIILVLLISCLSFIQPVLAQDGKAIYTSKCASCHILGTEGAYPDLIGLEDRHTWADHNDLLKWIQNPAAYMASDPYTAGLKTKYGSVMTAFPEFTLADVEAVVNYINNRAEELKNKKAGGGDVNDGGGGKNGNQNAVIFGVISLILAIIALILMQVNSNLKKMSDDASGIERPEPVPFYRNKVYIALLAIVFFVIGGYYLSTAAIGLQRQKNYAPEQPIFYSHKVHAGINQINCLYCHGNAWEGKTASIPSVNVCMNCHKTITEYTGPTLYNDKGEEVNGTAEIAKLHNYAGFDPKNPNAWDPSKSKPIEWVRIHNMPDHVYFNHSQHVRVGNVQCQTCHGDITGMDVVHQASELSMGWCVNCHRQTNVNFNYDSTKGNQYYSIFEKFHNDIKAGKMDSVSVKDIGGLECQRCHY